MKNQQLKKISLILPIWAIVTLYSANAAFSQTAPSEETTTIGWSGVWYLWDANKDNHPAFLIPLFLDLSKIENRSMITSLPDTLIISLEKNKTRMYVAVHLIIDIQEFTKKNTGHIDNFLMDEESLTIEYSKEQNKYIVDKWTLQEMDSENPTQTALSYLLDQVFFTKPPHFISYIDTAFTTEKLLVLNCEQMSKVNRFLYLILYQITLIITEWVISQNPNPRVPLD